MVLAAVKNKPRAFEYCSQRLKDDKEVVEIVLTIDMGELTLVTSYSSQVLPLLNPSLFTQEDRIRIYNAFMEAEAQLTQGKDLFLHAKMKRHFLS